jgi:hypothetical protein
MRAAVLAAAAALLAAVGCGSASSAPAQQTGTTAAAATPATSLTVTYWAQGRQTGGSKRWTLRCGPAGGNHPRAAAACTRLAGLRAPFAPPPKDVMCTQVFGGPQQGLVTGTYRGRNVSAQLSMRDGCEIARFKQLAFLFPGFSAAPNA